MPDASSVTCMVLVRAGSRYETRATRGIAHFAEHMLFKGTDRWPTSYDISSCVDEIGGEINGATGDEYTCFFIKCPANKRGLALDVLCDMIRRPRLDKTEIESERGVIQEEIDLCHRITARYMESLYARLLFGGQSLSWGAWGDKNFAKRANQRHLRDFLERWYTPDRIVIGIGGKLVGGEAQAIGEAKALFCDMEPRLSSDLDPVCLPDVSVPRVSILYDDDDASDLVIGTLSYPENHPDNYVVDVLTTILGGCLSSRLVTEIRERRGLSYDIFCGSYTWADAGSVYVTAGVSADHAEEVIHAIVQELRRVAKESVPEQELRKAKECLKGRRIFQVDSPQGLIEFGVIGEALRSTGAIDLQMELANIERVNQRDIQRVAKDLFDRQALQLALAGPFKNRERLKRLLH